jgi:hypothetical protein
MPRAQTDTDTTYGTYMTYGTTAKIIRRAGNMALQVGRAWLSRVRKDAVPPGENDMVIGESCPITNH